MSIRLPFANTARLLAALAFGIVLMTASSCDDCDEEQCDIILDSSHCCGFTGTANCVYEIGFRDSSGNMTFIQMERPLHSVIKGYRPPPGFRCEDKISESCVECHGDQSCE